MEARAKTRFLKMSPRKVRIVADLVRGKDVGEALDLLRFTRRAAAGPVSKLIESAMANAKQASSAIDVDSLFIKSLSVDMGPTRHMRRWRPRAMGRATRVVKGMSHVSVVLDIR
ncbi:MAG: 50S ribosomal protein L22 [Deltaproteobacteria bacterium]|nr:50S ribosomal protein L22 [Deltaproteobacteria bacterium]